MRSPLRPAMAALLLTCTAIAADFGALKPEGFVSDFAKVVDPASRQRLERYGEQLRKATGAEIAIVTLPSLQGEPIEDIANLLFRKWGVGQKGENQGVLLLLAIAERRSRLEVGYGLEPFLPDGSAGAVLREMRPALREGRYGEALLAAAEVIGGRIAQSKGIPLQAPERRRNVARRAPGSIPWPLVIGGAVLLLWLIGAGASSRRYGRRRTYGGGGGFLPGLILGNMMGRSSGYSGSSGGGFGGYDSSDSFGGFGGGDSGGGGASSDW